MESAEGIPSRSGQIDEKLLKPFSLGWTREVVRRVVAKNPACDIYYFSPNGKKIRSLNEIRPHLIDGLTLDCFSFKREILGVDFSFETIRDAKCRRKDESAPQKRPKFERGIKTEEPKPGPSGVQLKKRKFEEKKPDLSLEEEVKDVTEGKREEEEEEESEKVEVKSTPRRDATQGITMRKKRKRNSPTKVRLSEREKENFTVCKQMRQRRQLTRKQTSRKAIKKVTSGNSEKRERGNKEETDTKGKNDEPYLRRRERLVKKKNAEDENEEAEKDGKDEGNESTDLKSIVQKNIGKYRKLREKQKLTLIRGQMRRNRGGMVNSSRAESFLKNKSNYLKPLQKGWRRELVYRSNCSRAGLQADVYYFHPNGKKFRSSREILDNPGMIGGLSIEFFTFRKEAVGCGEPQEVIRNARTCQKNNQIL